jgi:AcrR family transcriptional regulator
MPSHEAALPPGIRYLWGLREPSRRGPRPTLTVDRIVRAGIEIADAEGLAALSMSRVADRLGFTTMSLYRHVANKEELLVLMWSAALDAPPETAGPGDDWRSGLRRWCRAQVAAFQARPWLIDVPISGPPITPPDLAWMDAGLRALARTGLSENDKLDIMIAFNAQARYQAKIFRDLMEAAKAGRPGMADYGRLLRELIDGERFPSVWRTVESGILDLPEGVTNAPDEADLEAGVELLLDGVAALIARRAEGDRPD